MRVAAALLLLAAGTVAVDITVGLKHRADGLRELEKMFWEVANPQSKEFRKYRTLADLTPFLRANEEHVSATTRWLEKLGCTSVETHTTRDAVTGRNCADSEVPSEIALVSDYVYKPTGNVFVEKTVRRTLKAAEVVGTPEKQKEYYKMPKGLKGTNASNEQLVWGCGTYGVAKTDLQSFYTKYCTDCSTDDVVYDTSAHGKPGGDNFVEGSLDATYITAFAPGVRTVVSNTNTSSATEEGNGQGIATVYGMEEIAKRAHVPQVLSLSLGSLGVDTCTKMCKYVEAKGTYSFKQCNDYIQSQRQVCLYATLDQQERINTAFKVMGLRGTSILAAAGDGGSHWSFGKFSEFSPIGRELNEYGCKYNNPVFPSSSPYVISVGGSAWNNGDMSSPTAWYCKTGSEGGTGGGFSWIYGAPEYQQQGVEKYLAQTLPTFPPSDSFNKSGRAYPDVATFMDGIPLCVDGSCRESIVGGTSAAAPTFAGIVSLLNDVRMNQGLPPLGFFAPQIWKVAQEHPGEAFLDIKVGITACGCDTGFSSTEGWDPLTGWGTPLWDGMVKYFASN